MDRITRIRIKNVRAIASLDLELGRPMTVLIGENGSGKSTLLECVELLRKATEPGFMGDFYRLHRGLPALLRKGATAMELGLTLESDDGEALEYAFTLRPRGAGAEVGDELLRNAKDGFSILKRQVGKVLVWDSRPGKKGYSELAIGGDALGVADPGVRAADPRMERVYRALAGLEVQLPFDARASWAARTYQRAESIRAASTLFPAERLQLLGVNLANAWAELLGRPSEDRERTLALVRLGLGERVDSVVIKPDMGGGNVYLALRFTDVSEPVFAADLSDGQLSWLAFVAMARLNGGRSLLAVDEPELHLHPHLLGGVISLFAQLDVPVLIATHADRVLELVQDPVDAVRVCALNEGGHATVARVDPEELPRWLEHFGDFGRLRAAGYLSRVLLPTPVAAAEEAG